MAQVKIKDSWHAERETIYINERSYLIKRGADAEVFIEDSIAKNLDPKIYNISYDDVKKPIKESNEKKSSVLDRIKEVTEDLLDDGKLNHSNNPDKQSPGRKKR